LEFFLPTNYIIFLWPLHSKYYQWKNHLCLLAKFSDHPWSKYWYCYIKLIMRENWLWKIYTNLFEWLPLTFFNSHWKTYKYRNLSKSKFEWNSCIRWCQRLSRYIYIIPNLASCYHISFKYISLHCCCDYQLSSIWVQVSNWHYMESKIVSDK
jgi:hypothetical protein